MATETGKRRDERMIRERKIIAVLSREPGLAFRLCIDHNRRSCAMGVLSKAVFGTPREWSRPEVAEAFGLTGYVADIVSANDSFDGTPEGRLACVVECVKALAMEQRIAAGRA